MRAQAIWFDFGGVLSPPIDELYSIYQSRTGISRVQMEAAMLEVARPYGLHPLAPIELATMTQKAWGACMVEALNRLYPGVDLSACDFENHGDQWFADIAPNAGMIELVHQTKAQGFIVGILTNNVVEWEKPWRKMVGLDDVVDHIVDSCKVGYRKPQREIFDLAARMAGVSAEECVLIDDLEENCAAARAAGWKAIVFRDNAQTERELDAFTAQPAFS